ncbi:MAG: hypothetical protein AAF404_05120 [Pseudomonadota bacterium]
MQPCKPMIRRIPLRTLAHGRAGDKGNILNLSVIAREPTDYAHLVNEVTVSHVAAVFESHHAQQIDRYLLPHLQAMNFVLHAALDGGVNRSLHQDRHGKTLSSLLLDSLITEPQARQRAR